MSEPIAFMVNGELVDTQTATQKQLQGTQVFYDNSANSLEVIRHSTAHLMAHAIKRLYPEAKFFVGPVIEDGFYYDFRVSEKIKDEDLKNI